MHDEGGPVVRRIAGETEGLDTSCTPSHLHTHCSTLLQLHTRRRGQLLHCLHGLLECETMTRVGKPHALRHFGQRAHCWIVA